MSEERLSLLILEDQEGAKAAIELLLFNKYKLDFAATCKEAYEKWNSRVYDVVLLDMELPDGSGLDVLKKIRQTNQDQEVIMVSGVNQSQRIVEAIKLGASDYVTKPVDAPVLFRALGKVEKTLKLNWEKTVLLQKVKDSENRFHGIVGQSPAMRRVCETLSKLKGNDTFVLLMGESGVGKEVIARAIHKQEENPLRPFIAVNCAAIPENLLESELFGHEKGSFTGAAQARDGKFIQADGGDIFLDEIACMSPTLQAKLLRVLQDKIVEPVGSNKQIKSNFRVIAATNHDIKTMIEKGTFRQDLYFRLQGVEIYIPPLRTRPEDIPLLVEHILKNLSPKFGVRHFASEALQQLMSYPWPGNVRELKNTIENMLIIHRDEVLDASHIPSHMYHNSSKEPQNMFSHLRANIKNCEKEVIVATLKRYRGNKSRASKELGISRSILYRKMNALGLKDSDIF
ncbi:MAG: sigma-54-dependent Fis family transcriptional regulator [Deltaproteobacteria bacterium]|nr:sigma-54-dependent Fis family transcriptional regulator [Deltaproteobacteria bacterium]